MLDQVDDILFGELNFRCSPEEILKEGRPVSAANSGSAARPSTDIQAQPRVRWRALRYSGWAMMTLAVLVSLFGVYRIFGTNVEYSFGQREREVLFETIREGRPELRMSENNLRPPDEAPVFTAEPIALEVGDPVMRVRVETAGVDHIVSSGRTLRDLKSGPTIDPLYSSPGELGNVVVYGHRTTYGSPFLRMNEVKVGDIIDVEDVSGLKHEYRVTRTEIVTPTRVDALSGSGDAATISLVTCHPVWSTAQRMIVHGELVGSAPTPSPINLVPDIPAPEERVDVGLAVENNPSQRFADLWMDPNPSTGIVEEIVVRVPTYPDVSEAFEDGWFADSGAWLHIIGWGSLLSLLSTGLLFARKRLNMALFVAALVMSLPFFTVFLYFFFQNVDRVVPSVL